MSTIEPDLYSKILYYNLARDFDNNDVYKSINVLAKKVKDLLSASSAFVFRLGDDSTYSRVRPAGEHESKVDLIIKSYLNRYPTDFEKEVGIGNIRKIMGLKLDNYFLVVANGLDRETHQDGISMLKDAVLPILNNASSAIDMTGLKNRSSYDNTRLNYLASAEKPVTLVSIDLFNLKEVNDDPERGSHVKGDEYIKGVANILATNFQGFADIYRTGGDEFVLLIDREYSEIEDELRDRIGKSCLDTSELDIGLPGVPLRMNYGIAYGSSHNIEGIRSVADELLKRNKTNIYVALKKDRRSSKLNRLEVASVTRTNF